MASYYWYGYIGVLYQSFDEKSAEPQPAITLAMFMGLSTIMRTGRKKFDGVEIGQKSPTT